MTNLDNIPLELRNLDHWVIWKGDKKPRNPRNNQPASVSDPRTWDSFENACKAAKEYRAKGVGFVFTEDDKHSGIDLDKVIDENGVIDPEAQAIIDKLDSYSEVSQSGRGIHIIGKGKKPTSRCRRDNVEIYDKGRYFALTGDLWQGRGVINDIQEALNWLCEDTFDETSETTGTELGAIKFLDGVPEGERDWDAYRYACRLFGKGLSKDEVTPMVLLAASRCDPPFPEEEALAKVESASKYESKQKAAPATPEIISARKLNEIDFPALKFAIPGMIPEGLTILAGKPKSGKSWLALQAAYSVALGKNLMDGSQIERGCALVLGLEDGQRRLQSRIRKLNASDCVLKVIKEEGRLMIRGNLGGDIPEGLDLAVSWPKIEEGGIEELEKYLDSHPETRLIVVDIIKRIQKKKGKGTTYDEDYQSIQPLQELATRRRVAILGVHHVRKALSDDPLDMVSGTFGLTGGVDSVLVMQREEGDFRLSVQGRDIEERELAIKFDDCLWRLMGNAGDYFISEEREGILGCLTDEGLTPKEIADLLGKGEKRATIRSLLAKMLRDGQVVRDSKGRYSTKKPEGGA